MMRVFLGVAGIGGMISVIAGAMAAHSVADPKVAELLRTGALYGMVHAVALVALVALVGAGSPQPPRSIAALIAGWAFTAGIVMFSGSLFALAAGSARWVGIVTPFGGVGFILGWAAIGALAFWR